MFKKKKENKNYSENNSLMIKFLHLQTDEYITKFIKSRYKEGQYVDVSSTGTDGRLKLKLIHDKVGIVRIANYVKIYIGTVKVWDNQQKEETKRNSKLAKIVS